MYESVAFGSIDVCAFRIREIHSNGPGGTVAFSVTGRRDSATGKSVVTIDRCFIVIILNGDSLPSLAESGLTMNGPNHGT
jgi:hypothetical protein